jgi:GTPase
MFSTGYGNEAAEPETSIIIGLFDSDKPEHQIKRILEEMKLLTQSAGGKVLKYYYQKRKTPDKRYLIGTGKTADIKNFAAAKKVNLVIFYNTLSGVQQRNLERFFKRKVVDRTRLILDVFATRAQTLEGKLQVELAQLLYMLPRLAGRGRQLSRLGGGIGTRGPGETRLEVDRRTIKRRITIIKKKLAKVIKNRTTQRKSRQSNPVPVISLVGYTSAGKSTLFKTLTRQDVPISRMLFSTLDPVLRRVELKEIKEGYYFLLSDTVGFIREMPKELFQSFKATLEEVVQSDLILHVVDISDEDYVERKNDVLKVLKDMRIPEQKVITVYNKIDLLENDGELELHRDEAEDIGENDVAEPNGQKGNNRIYISAKKEKGIKRLKQEIFYNYFHDYEQYTLEIPVRKLNPATIRKWAIVVNHEINRKKRIENIKILCSTKNMIKFKEKYGGFVK